MPWGLCEWQVDVPCLGTQQSCSTQLSLFSNVLLIWHCGISLDATGHKARQPACMGRRCQVFVPFGLPFVRLSCGAMAEAAWVPAVL
jgi:hypothetical protein